MAVNRAIAAAVIALAACDADDIVIRPVIDLPVDDPDATATSLSDIILSVAQAGSDSDITSFIFRRGQPLELSGVPFGEDLVIHMLGKIDQSNVAYGRTCAVSIAPGGEPPTPHLFFSRTVKFASVDIAAVPRFGGLGISHLGAAMLIGGTDGSGQPLTEVERFDPATGVVSPFGTVKPRERAVQALLGTKPPRVVVIGGISSGLGASYIEVLGEQGIDTHDTPEMARENLTATSLTDGRVIVIGGNPPGGLPSGEIDEIIDVEGSPETRQLVVALRHRRSGHTATRLGEDFGAPVLIAGGINELGTLVRPAELFKPLTKELADPLTFAPEMQIPRRHHVAMLMPDNSVLFLGGIDAAGLPVTTVERFSIDAGFVVLDNLPPGAGVVDFTATTLPDGRILLTGGRQTPSSPPVDTAYIAQLDPLDGSVDIGPTDRLAAARAGHQAVVLCDGTVLITGGTGGELPAERYNPPATGRR
jgi:hypothetical protein